MATTPVVLEQRPTITLTDIGKEVRENLTDENFHPATVEDYPCSFCNLWEKWKRQACFYCIHNPDCGMYPVRPETDAPSPLDHEQGA